MRAVGGSAQEAERASERKLIAFRPPHPARHLADLPHEGEVSCARLPPETHLVNKRPMRNGPISATR
jgi:hypothetical protein